MKITVYVTQTTCQQATPAYAAMLAWTPVNYSLYVNIRGRSKAFIEIVSLQKQIAHIHITEVKL